MISEKTKWFNQSVFTYKDKHYGTEGYLRLSISTNTEDYTSFNSPSLLLSINNNYQKSLTFHLSECNDLIKTFKTMTLNGEVIEIQRKYKKDIFYLKFFVDKNTNERLVLVEIRNNETDFTKVIMPLLIQFEAFMTCLRQFSEKYIDTCMILLTKTIDSTIYKSIEQMPGLLRGISSNIVTEERIQESRAPEPGNEQVQAAEQTIEQLDRFLGNEMQNIKVPEIEVEVKENVQKVESFFVEKVIENDLKNLENILINCTTAQNPIESFSQFIKSKDNEEFTPLPGLSEDDKKSLLYISKMLFLTSYKSYLTNGGVLPDRVPIFKYKPSVVVEKNNEVATDLLVLHLFVRSIRRRLEGKSSDATLNKALFYFQFRCFVDPLIFSFMDDKDGKRLENIVMTRYKYFKSIGIFNSYFKLLEDMNCVTVNDDDIKTGVLEVIENVIRKTPLISALHQKLFDGGGVKLPSSNTFSLEQILNEIVPFEVDVKLGADIKNEEVLKGIKRKNNISDEILNYLLKGKTKVRSEKKKEDSNLLRFVKFYDSEIPDEVKEKFFEYIDKNQIKKYDFTIKDFDLDLFGDNIVKGLYIWDPEKYGKNYKEFFSTVESELMSKELIIAKVKQQESLSNSVSTEWNFG
jgi:hypothetical protein